MNITIENFKNLKQLNYTIDDNKINFLPLWKTDYSQGIVVKIILLWNVVQRIKEQTRKGHFNSRRLFKKH